MLSVQKRGGKMVKGCYVDSNGMKKGAWSEEEDNRLRQFIQKHGHPNWRLLPKIAGLARSGKSCRLRWVNYLKPGVRRGKYTKEEVALIIQLHAKLGNKWSAIAKYFPGRTDNDIKNYWNANMRRRCKSKKQTCTIQELLESGKSENSVAAMDNANCVELRDAKTSWDELNHFESFDELNFEKLLSPNPYISGPYYYLSEETSCSSDAFAETQDDFWTEPGGGLFYF